MSAVGLIREGEAGDDPERIREGMSGNICRCGAYAGITEAVREAQRRNRRGRTEDRMNRFDYVRPATVAEAVAAAAEPGAAYLAAGTNLLDLMKAGAARPSRLVDVTRLPGLDRIEHAAGRRGQGRRPGPQCRPRPRSRPSRAPIPRSPRRCCRAPRAQLRNAATVGGNLLQRTRCAYFTDPASACNRREPGAGCDARGGENRGHAILGWSDACIATHPSDFCVPLVALDAVVEIIGPAGPRELPLEELHRLPGDSPERENALAPGELIVALRLPAEAAASRAHARYLKLRERTSFAFALVSAAASLEIADGTIGRARLALGGVAAKPWRARGAEALLEGARADPRRLRPRGRGGARRGAAVRATTPTRSSSPSGSPRGRCSSPPPGRPSACRRCPHPSSPTPEPSPMPDTLPPPAGHVRLGSNSGQPMTRRDGVLKVTGAATYAADNHPAGLLHAVCAVSTIARGRVASLDVAAAKAHPGVVEVITPANRPPLAGDPDAKPTMFSWRIEALQDDRVRYANQPIALVVAETLEAATEGARLLAPDLRGRARPDRLRRRRAVPCRKPLGSPAPPASRRATSPPASRPPHAGPRPRSRRRSSTTTPWSRMRSSRRGTATG